MKIGCTSQHMDFESRKGGRKTSSCAKHFRRFIWLWIAALTTHSTEKKKNLPEGGAEPPVLQ